MRELNLNINEDYDGEVVKLTGECPTCGLETLAPDPSQEPFAGSNFFVLIFICKNCGTIASIQLCFDDVKRIKTGPKDKRSTKVLQWRSIPNWEELLP